MRKIAPARLRQVDVGGLPSGQDAESAESAESFQPHLLGEEQFRRMALNYTVIGPQPAKTFCTFRTFCSTAGGRHLGCSRMQRCRLQRAPRAARDPAPSMTGPTGRSQELLTEKQHGVDANERCYN